MMLDKSSERQKNIGNETNLLLKPGQLANNHELKLHTWAFGAQNNHLVAHLEDWQCLGAEHQEACRQTMLRWDLHRRIRYQ